MLGHFLLELQDCNVDYPFRKVIQMTTPEQKVDDFLVKYPQITKLIQNTYIRGYQEGIDVAAKVAENCSSWPTAGRHIASEILNLPVPEEK